MCRLGAFALILFLPILASAHRNCNWDGKSYAYLEVFSHANGCSKLQCQNNGAVAVIEKACGKEKDNRCHKVNEQFISNKVTYLCKRNTKGDYKYVVAPSLSASCTVGGKTYQDKEIFPSSDGCSTLQCQNRDIVTLNPPGCRDKSGKCFAENLMWKVNISLFQCINKDPWGLAVARIFFDEPDPIPVCENQGKDVYFLLDASDTVGENNFKKQRKFAAQITKRFFIGKNRSNAEFLFGGIIFSTEAKLLFDLNKYLSLDQLYKALLAVPYDAGWTRTDFALNLLSDKKLFKAGSRGKSDADNYVILVTDGQSNDPAKTKKAARLVRQFATILCVGVGSKVNNTELLDIAGSSENVFHIASFDALKQVQEKFSEKICAIKKQGNNGR